MVCKYICVGIYVCTQVYMYIGRYVDVGDDAKSDKSSIMNPSLSRMDDP